MIESLACPRHIPFATQWPCPSGPRRDIERTIRLIGSSSAAPDNRLLNSPAMPHMILHALFTPCHTYDAGDCSDNAILNLVSQTRMDRQR